MMNSNIKVLQNSEILNGIGGGLQNSEILNGIGGGLFRIVNNQF
jgi:hypothetical protein